jgi:DNA-binding transcriptional ArsR family regulator
MKIETDRDLMKVLSSDTRLEILKVLGERQLTSSDLSRRLNKHKSTIVEHLQVLQAAGLVEKDEKPGRKWIFYSLTDEGREVVSPVPERRVKVISRILSLAFAVFAFVFVAAAGVIATEYVFHLPMLLLPMVSDLAYFVCVGIAVLGIASLYLKKVPRRGIYVSVIVGLLVLPYAQFVFGHMDFFVKDEAMIKGVRAEEVRFALTVEMHDVDTGEWVTAIDSALMTLYPGENYVYLDSVNLPAGKYDQSRATTDCEVDIVVDLNIARPELAEADVDDAAIQERISTDLKKVGAELKNYRREGLMLYYTIALTKVEVQPEKIDYPGYGGPDIYLHIILDELGRPTSIEKTVKMPPGFGKRGMQGGGGAGSGGQM